MSTLNSPEFLTALPAEIDAFKEGFKDRLDEPFTVYPYFESDHAADVSESIRKGEILALEESGFLLGYILCHNEGTIEKLNRYAVTRGMSSETFRVRTITDSEGAARPWCVEECLVDEDKGGIIAYLTDSHSLRLAIILNVVSLKEGSSSDS